jgi:hypothetical protein
VGQIPAEIGLRWLVNQRRTQQRPLAQQRPLVHTIVPGMSCLEHLEMDVAAVERYRSKLDRETCRICDERCG